MSKANEAAGAGALPELSGEAIDAARGRAEAESAAKELGTPFYESLGEFAASHEFLTHIPISFARRQGVIGFAREDGGMTVALAEAGKWQALEVVARTLGKEVKPVFAPRDEILHAINTAYQELTNGVQRVIEDFNRDEVMRELEEASGNEDLLDVAGRAPVIKLVNLIIFEAVKKRASDIHVQPYEERLVVRLRVDGILHDAFHPPKALQEEIISRIKVMGGMNIAERRLAQDGRATVEVGDRIIDLRIATLPTSFGERVVLRLLDKSTRKYELEELGMPARDLANFRRLIGLDHGMILVTGPTGSGKTTTLYSALQEMNFRDLNMLTLEDPIEYRLDGISQTQVSEKKGMTFASGLRHVLRQDPDVIMVGEIRDGETAHMAIQSALTGHLVFSTLHTNDASGAVARMLDLGVEPYLLASSLMGVLAQRLVRRICPECSEGYQPTQAERELWGLEEARLAGRELYRGKGCGTCMGTGYRERMGIFELLMVDEPVRELILKSGKASSIKAAALAGGMTSLWADGVAKALAGMTTMEEVARVTSVDDLGSLSQ